MPTNPQVPDHAAFRIDESLDIPLLGIIFGWAPMVPFLFGAAAAWTSYSALAIRLTVIWGGGVLAFLAGVRRGLSFRTPGGEALAQIVTMLWLFLLAVAALASAWPMIACLLLLAGYASIAVLDPRAAEQRQVPLFFARLRPVQMVIPVASLGAIIGRLLSAG